ncbi:MAG: hypothetical protein LPJ89_07225, partial [Hymenobacteraceae bacterium]|nr:hypothetical protein [Hymenobacteraceae bacterium]
MTDLHVIFFSFLSCFLQKEPENSQKIVVTDGLEVTQISEHTWRHVSFIDVPGYGKFPCNGVVYVSGGEAIILDTPLSDSLSLELIHFVEKELKANVIGLVVNHFHEDCTAGLQVFHERNIKTYSSHLTCTLLKNQRKPCATHLFKKSETIQVGNHKIRNRYFGEGHSKDNIVTWIPEDRVLFGGCLIKEVGAGKGNLA